VSVRRLALTNIVLRLGKDWCELTKCAVFCRRDLAKQRTPEMSPAGEPTPAGVVSDIDS